MMDDADDIRLRVQDILTRYQHHDANVSDDSLLGDCFIANKSNSSLLVRALRGIRHMRFVDDVQLHFGIYFSPEEIKSSHTFSDFVKLVQTKLHKNKAGAIRSLAYHSGYPAWIPQFVVLNLLLALFAPVVMKGIGTLLACSIGLLANVMLATVHLRERSYNKRLLRRIQQR